MDQYINELIENSKPHIGRKLKVVVDGGNGVGGMTGPRVLRGLGFEVIELYCDPDGRFPYHHPDPTVMENIVELRETVVKTGADLGIGWDGDADRIGAVDEGECHLRRHAPPYLWPGDSERQSPVRQSLEM